MSEAIMLLFLYAFLTWKAKFYLFIIIIIIIIIIIKSLVPVVTLHIYYGPVQ